jgi:hypothetical protein
LRADRTRYALRAFRAHCTRVATLALLAVKSIDTVNSVPSVDPIAAIETLLGRKGPKEVQFELNAAVRFRDLLQRLRNSGVGVRTSLRGRCYQGLQ